MQEYLYVTPGVDKGPFFVVSWVSAHGYFSVTRDFGLHGRLPGIKIPYICIEAATMAQYMGTYPGVGACRYIQYAHLLLYMFSWLFSTPNLEGSTTPNACSGKPVRVMQEAEPVIIGAQL